MFAGRVKNENKLAINNNNNNNKIKTTCPIAFSERTDTFHCTHMYPHTIIRTIIIIIVKYRYNFFAMFRAPDMTCT